jgi:hypothetical protein
MTKEQRKQNLMPNGIPKYIRIYDNQECWDHYTVVFSGKYNSIGVKSRSNPSQKTYYVIGMSSMPFSPVGFCSHESYDKLIDVNSVGFAPAIGRKNHLGRRITFDALADDCKKVVIEDYMYIWNLKK